MTGRGSGAEPTRRPSGPSPHTGPAGVATSVMDIDSHVLEVRFTGYLPMATHVTMSAVADHPGLRDVSDERRDLLPLYRELRRVDDDPTWDEALVDAELAMLPVYPAAGVLDDDLLRAGTGRVVISSASSRTSMAVGRLLVERGIPVTGLSGPARVQAAASVGAYTQVLPYDDLADLDVHDGTTFLDVAGDPSIARAVVDRLGAALSQTIAVGGSRLTTLAGPPAPGPARPGPPVVRFSTAQREVDLAEQLGRAAVDRIEQRARRLLVPWAAQALRVEPLRGLTEAADAWTRVGSGDVDALTALMISP